MDYIAPFMYFIVLPLLLTHIIVSYIGLKCLKRQYKREPEKFQWGYYNLYEVGRWVILFIPIIGWYISGNVIIEELRLQFKLWIVRRLLKKVSKSLRKRGFANDAATLDAIRNEVKDYAALNELKECLNEDKE